MLVGMPWTTNAVIDGRLLKISNRTRSGQSGGKDTFSLGVDKKYSFCIFQLSIFNFQSFNYSQVDIS